MKPMRVHVLDNDMVEATTDRLGILLDFKNPRLLKNGNTLQLDQTLAQAGILEGDTLEIEEAA
jgi:hypothetical protein